MAEEQGQRKLAHIAFEREPNVEAERRRRNPPPPPPRVAARSQHGSRIASEVSSAAQAVGAARQHAGVDPSRLLVLEFSSWNGGVRDIFETRLNVVVVDESTETRQLTRVIALPPGNQSVDAVAHRIESAAYNQEEDRDGPLRAEKLRVRRGNKGDLDRAKRLGITISEEVAASPQSLVVVDAVEWDTATDKALRDLGLVPVARLQDTAEITRVLVQFPTGDDVNRFVREARFYERQETGTTALPQGLRRDFFDGLDWARPRRREDRIGPRLSSEGFPNAERFFLDVDLWHPGTPAGARTVLDELRSLCAAHGGRVVDDFRTSSLVLARTEGGRALAELLLDLDIVAQVNLPPVLPASYGGLFDSIDPLPDHLEPDGTEPIVGVVDSGVLAGHTLLRGWVLDERDFDSGEETAVDEHGHGTGVAGLAIYGDLARCIETGDWTPRAMVVSAKVLRRDPHDESRPTFPETHRPEKLVENAVRYFNRERQCRVFNLSVGNAHDVYAGGRQFAWAEVLDRLARELDVILVVSAGNVATPPWPQAATTRERFQGALRDLILEVPQTRVCNPATAAIAVTVGALARSERSMRRHQLLVAAPAGAPAPFSRVGPGYEPRVSQRAVKPDFVSFGGNYAVRDFPGPDPAWVRQEIYLGEPTTRLSTDGGRVLTAKSGTSFAAPQVSFAAAFALRAAGQTLGSDAPTANSARALLGACAEVPPCGLEWLRDPEGKETWEKLRLVGYGRVDVERVVEALQHDVCLLAEDSLVEDHWHVYAIRMPPAFLAGRGRRGLSVSLAFDPPVRASRRDYLSRTMWVEVLKGLKIEEIDKYRSRRIDTGGGLSLPQSKVLSMRPPKTDVQWSTLQVRRYSWSRAISLPAVDGDEERELHVLVGCQQRFPSGEDQQQRYALAIRFWHTDASVEIHQQLRSRVRARVVARVRPRG